MHNKQAKNHSYRYYIDYESGKVPTVGLPIKNEGSWFVLKSEDGIKNVEEGHRYLDEDDDVHQFDSRGCRNGWFDEGYKGNIGDCNRGDDS